MKSLLRLLVLVIVFTHSIVHSAEKPGLVLMPLRVIGVEVAYVQSLESAVASGLSAKYKVYKGSRVVEKLTKIFQKVAEETPEGKECDTTKCLQNIAIEFQAELVATTTVVKNSSGYLLTLNISNVLEDALVFSESMPCEGCNEFQVIGRLKVMAGGEASRSVQPIAPQASVSIPDPSPPAIQKTGNSRYVNNRNGTVTDNKTALVWQQEDAYTQLNWKEALTYCEQLSLGGDKYWRLPSKSELESIVDKSGGLPTIDTTYFPDTETSWYWSSSTFYFRLNAAHRVNFYNGIIWDVSKETNNYVRCVRSGE